MRASNLNWTLVQPVHLTDRPRTGRTHLSTSSAVHDMRVTREQVAAVLADAAEATRPARQTIAVSTTRVDAAAKAATSSP